MIWATRGHMVTMGGHCPRSRVTLSEDESRAEEPRHKDNPSRRRKIIQRVVIVLSVLVLVLASAFVIAYKKLEGNINAVTIGDALGDDRPEPSKVEGPKRPLNVLVMGSDNRDGHQHRRRHPGALRHHDPAAPLRGPEPRLRREPPARRDGRAARVHDQERQADDPRRR